MGAINRTLKLTGESEDFSKRQLEADFVSLLGKWNYFCGNCVFRFGKRF
jgi:hypothetical protein